MQQKTIAIAGGTGLVGSHLSRYLLAQGHRVIILSRNPAAAAKDNQQPLIEFAGWNPETGAIDEAAMAEAHAIVNLAGAGVVDKSWTPAYRKLIQESRTKSGATIVKFLETHRHKVTTVVNASAIGWYGADTNGKPFDEEAPAAPGFLGDTCQLWEQSIQPVQSLGIRLVVLRLGIVLANEGGALPEFKKSLAFRVAGVLGNGRQMVSWIHVEDVCRIIHFAIENDGIDGIYNAVAPVPVTNRAMNMALGKAMYGNAFIALPVPAFVIKLMLGSRSVEVLKSTTVSAEKIQKAGFQFNFAQIEDALQNLVGK